MVTNVNEVSKLLLLFFQWEQRRDNAKKHLHRHLL